MITCPWCSTNYTTFQSNCKNCGGPLPLPPEKSSQISSEELTPPPPSPRQVPENYVWQLLFNDGLGIAASVFLFLGIIFGVVGTILTIVVVTAFIGIPFALLGTVFAAGGAFVLVQRYQGAQKTITILKSGEAVLGKIQDVRHNLFVKVNGRHPWVIIYEFEVNGYQYTGSFTTLYPPRIEQQAGKDIYVLYLFEDPTQNTIYPHPYQ